MCGGDLPAARGGGVGRGGVDGPETHCALGQRDANASVLGGLVLRPGRRELLIWMTSSGMHHLGLLATGRCTLVDLLLMHSRVTTLLVPE